MNRGAARNEAKIEACIKGVLKPGRYILHEVYDNAGNPQGEAVVEFIQEVPPPMVSALLRRNTCVRAMKDTTAGRVPSWQIIGRYIKSSLSHLWYSRLGVRVDQARPESCSHVEMVWVETSCLDKGVRHFGLREEVVGDGLLHSACS